ncbi:hypothetical protein [Halocola ammonii]
MTSLKVFIENLVNTFLSILRMIFFSRFVKTSRIISPKNSELIILGNGPSLKNFLAANKSLVSKKELLCVNHFAESDVYKALKPKYYVLAAPEMWMDDVEEFHFRKGEKLFSAISENTEWPVTLFIPQNARKFERWKKKIAPNANIQIVYFSSTPIEGFRFFENWAFSKWLGMPRPHNVLIPSLILSVNIGFQKIFIAGADHSWMKEIFVSDDNIVYLTQKHFYDSKEKEAAPMDKLGKGSRKMHEILIKFVHAFRGYFKIKEYAGHCSVEIFNITEHSMIDAFERIKPEEIE